MLKGVLKIKAFATTFSIHERKFFVPELQYNLLDKGVS
jgi:hypothetical protein